MLTTSATAPMVQKPVRCTMAPNTADSTKVATRTARVRTATSDSSGMGRDSRDLPAPLPLHPAPASLGRKYRFDSCSRLIDLRKSPFWLESVPNPHRRRAARPLKSVLLPTARPAPAPAGDTPDPTMPDQPTQARLAALSKSFDPATVEAHWGPAWEQAGLGRAGWRGTGQANAEAAAAGHNFAIQLPPPNVTGTLHMGHAFNQTIMDSLTRYHRMRGFNTAWIPGTDHAGIATQIVVERQLQAQGQSRHDLGRKNFVARVWEWKASRAPPSRSRCAAWATAWTGAASTSPWTTSCPRWSPRPSCPARAGPDLPRQAPGQLGPELKSAVSDLEVESTRKTAFCGTSPTPGGRQRRKLVVATTRPETMLGDVAVMVHPEDERYQR
jgi:hypothetical protein